MIMSFQTDLSFGREYTAAIEAKQVGESATTDSNNNIIILDSPQVDLMSFEVSGARLLGHKADGRATGCPVPY